MIAFIHEYTNYRFLLVICAFLIHNSLAVFPECFHWAECADSSVLKGDNIECYGYESCKFLIIYSTDTINGLKCHGFRSCEQPQSSANTIDLYSDGDISCSGESSCQNANMDAVGNVICDGRSSCSNCNIKSANNVLCSGPSSCSLGSTIDVINGDIICDGTRGCDHAGTMKGVRINCSGNFGCASSTIIAQTVECYGYYGCESANIDSIGHVAFQLHLEGSNAGANAKVYCRGTTNTCTVICRGSGCKNTEICYTTGITQLNIDPVGCETNSNGIINGIDCPIINQC